MLSWNSIIFIVVAVKKAYYKCALKVHPDRVAEDEKEEATEKFKILAKLNEVLSDDSRRALYDEQGIIDDDDDEKFGSTWLEAFKTLFKPISDTDIDNYRKEYIGELNWCPQPLWMSAKFFIFFRIWFGKVGLKKSLCEWKGLHKLHDGTYSVHGCRRWGTIPRYCRWMDQE